jgi:hypothetical protein
MLEHVKHPPRRSPKRAGWRPIGSPSRYRTRPGKHGDHGRTYTAEFLFEHALQGGILYGNVDVGHLDRPPFAVRVAILSM